MFWNYLKIALRHFNRQRIFTGINILGLSIGMASCLLIYMYIHHHATFDKYHRNLGRTYVFTISDAAGAPDRHSARTCCPSAKALRDNFPEVERIAGVLDGGDGLVVYGDKTLYEMRAFTESALFDLLTIPFIKGDPLTALDNPGTVVISQRVAKKFFGDEDPIGQTIKVNRGEYEITGVVADAPAKTHFKYDVLASFKTIEKIYPVDAWNVTNMLTYVRLRAGVSPASMTGRLATILEDYSGIDMTGLKEDYVYGLEPISGIHLDADMESTPEPGLNPLYLRFFAAIGTFILIIACINFINLNTARSTRRAREVGIRKVSGASKKHLVLQYLGESTMMAAAALVISLIIFDLSISPFGGMSGIEISMSDLAAPGAVLLMAVMVILAGLAAGIYPAFMLSSFNPVDTLKQSMLSGPKGGVLRRILVVGQFAMAAVLIIGTSVIFRQLDFMKNVDLGFDREQKLVVPLRYPVDLGDDYNEVKQDFLAHSSISGAAMSTIVPGETESIWSTAIAEGPKKGDYVDLYYNFIDPSYPAEYALKLAAGRFPDHSISTDVDSAYVLNMAAVRKYGWASPEDPIGAKLEWGENRGVVVGVVEDFHFEGLQTPIMPLCLVHGSGKSFRRLTLTVQPGNIAETISFVESTFKKRFPGAPFDYYFLDERFNMQYESVEKVSRLFCVFTIIGLFIACLGLFGLALFMAEQKKKEVGVRKVLGATTIGIVSLMTRDFMKWVLAANLIACPVSYLIMRKWLENFAYRTEIGAAVFLFALAATAVVALLAVGSQVFKAASANPAEALKS